MKFALLFFVILLNFVLSSFSQIDKTLRFNSDGTFKIVQFTDLHYGEQPPSKDVNSAAEQELILNIEKPDLVVMTGDSVSGYAWPSNHPSGWFAERWYDLTLPMMKLGYRWSFALGNHDAQADLNRTQIVALDQTYPNSLTQFGPSNLIGVTNYVLPVYANDSQQVITNLWHFDSMVVNCENVTGWGCVNLDVVEWYMKTSHQITKNNNGKIIPGLSFFHIPPPELMDIWNTETVYGRKDEAVCCFSVNTGIVSAILEMQDIKAIFNGHDHDNDYFGYFSDVMLAYGRKSGFGGYGPPPFWKRGARVIELTQNPFSIKIWIREQDGTLVDSQPKHPADPILHQDHCCGTVSAETKYRNKCAEYEEAYRKKYLN